MDSKLYQSTEGVPWSFWTWFEVPHPITKQTILRRLRLLKTPLFAIYMHWIFVEDQDRHVHDHPWNFWSLILRGGYKEEFKENLKDKTKSRNWKRFSLHKMPIHHAHRIASLKPRTTTLLLVGPRKRTWGFWTDKGWVPYHKYDRRAGPDPFMS